MGTIMTNTNQKCTQHPPKIVHFYFTTTCRNMVWTSMYICQLLQCCHNLCNNTRNNDIIMTMIIALCHKVHVLLVSGES